MLRKKERQIEGLVWQKGFDWLSDSAALTGTVMFSGKGTGKTRGVTRDLVWRRFLRGIGQIYIDPVNAGALNFFDKLRRFLAQVPPEKRAQLWQRVRYYRLYGSHVPGLPLYYRVGQESLYEISQRFLDVLLRIDPQLKSAAVEGWNALHTLGTNVGMILAALDLQITEAESLVQQPHYWQSQFEEALRRYPEVEPAVRFFRQEYKKWDPRKKAAFLNKIKVFSLDPLMRAMFGANHLSLNVQEIREQGLTVFIDTSGVTDSQRKLFLNMWVFQLILNSIKQTGAGRHKPLAIYVDELAGVVNTGFSGGMDLIAEDVDVLANEWSRQASVMYFFMSQQPFQFNQKLLKTLLSSGNLVIGRISDEDDAIELARHLFPYRSDRVKQEEPVYAGMPPQVIDYRKQLYSIQEQREIASRAFTQLPKFRSLVRAALAEGQVHGQLLQMTLEVDRGIWVDEDAVKQLLDRLAVKDGIPVVPQTQTGDGAIHQVKTAAKATSGVAQAEAQSAPPAHPATTQTPQTAQYPLDAVVEKILADLTEALNPDQSRDQPDAANEND